MDIYVTNGSKISWSNILNNLSMSLEDIDTNDSIVELRIR